MFAAISTSEPLHELVSAFQLETHQTVTLSLGASSDLARQILAGAPADIFLSADSAQMDRLAAQRLLKPEQRDDLLSNQLAVIVPTASQVQLRRPEDLLLLKRLALADPVSVPVGVYARQWLQSKGIWEQLSSAVVPTLDARAALAAVESEGVEAGIVYLTDAALSKKVRVALSIPREDGPKIVYPVAVLARSQHPAAASFEQFLRSKGARSVFARYGFVPLP